VLIDLAANMLFQYPRDEKAHPPSSLQTYFEYGRSVEGKLRKMIGPTDESTDKVSLAGWLDPERWKDLPAKPAQPSDVLVAVYGMSFAFHAAETLHELDPRYILRCIGGPAAPPNHSYAAYTIDRTHLHANVAILGVLASSIRAMSTVTGATWAFERPYAYTYPRYTLDAQGRLQAFWPSIASVADMREALANPARWTEYLHELKEHDDYYSTLLLRESILDSSATVRLLRRGWAQHSNLEMISKVHGSKGFVENSPAISVLRAIVTNFGETARADGSLPVVLLVNDRGYADHLFKALAPTLEKTAIPYVSTHDIAPATDPDNFVADGHFTTEANARIAKKLQDLIRDKLGDTPPK